MAKELRYFGRLVTQKKPTCGAGTQLCYIFDPDSGKNPKNHGQQ
jgi:hypothetical protein